MPAEGRHLYNGQVHGVVVAVYRPADKHWLMIRRSKNVVAPRKVCFPGGGRESGETHEQTALREMREELGLHVKLLEQVWVHEDPSRGHILFGYLAVLEPERQEITTDPHEVEEPIWLTAEQALAHPDALPNSAFFISNLLKALPKHDLCK